MNLKPFGKIALALATTFVTKNQIDKLFLEKIKDRKKKVKLFIQLVSKVALADGLLSDKEFELIEDNLPNKKKISRNEIEVIIMEEKSNPTELCKLADQIISKPEAEAIIRLSVEIANVDGDCTPEERSVLECFCKAWNISTEILNKSNFAV